MVSNPMTASRPNPAATLKRLRRFLDGLEKKGLPIEENIQHLRGLIGCSRSTIYRWWREEQGMNPLYSAAVVQALDEIEKK